MRFPPPFSFNSTFTLNVGSDGQCLNVSIVSDKTFEGEEEVIVMFSSETAIIVSDISLTIADTQDAEGS